MSQANALPAQLKALPSHPNLSHLKKIAKRALLEARNRGFKTQLTAVQLAIARQYGFASWKKLKAHVEANASKLTPESFLEAVRSGDSKSAKRHLDAQPDLITSRTEPGETALHLAAERNDPTMIKLLLDRGADPSVKYGQSAHNALSWALTTQAFDAADALLKAGVKPDLFCASGLGALDAVKTFFDSDGNVKPGASETGSSRFAADGSRLPRPPTDPREIVSDALYIASRNGKAEVVRYLLERDPDVNFRAYMNGTPLHWAYFSGSREVIDMLLKAGADPALRDSEFNCTPRAFGICTACNWGIERIVRDLLNDDPTLARIFEGRGTPLHEAARAGHPEVTKILLAAGADRSAKDVDGSTPLDLARKFKRDDVIKLLDEGATRGDLLNEFLEASVVPNDGSDHRGGRLDRAQELLKTNPQLRDSFLAACVRGDHKRMAQMIKIDPMLATAPGGSRGWTPLLYVCFSRFMRIQAKRAGDFAKCVKLLLGHGADPNSNWIDKRYQPRGVVETALYGAVGVSNNPALTKLLLKAGASVAEADLESLYHASEHKDNRCLKLILEAKPPVDDVSYCLARKLDFEDLEGARLYLKHGADVNFQTQHGTRDMRLHHAVRRGRSTKIIELLLKYGADVSLQNGEGLTAYQLARRLGYTKVARLLLKHGAVDDLDDRARFLAACAGGDAKTARAILQSQPNLLKDLPPHDQRLLADAADAGHFSAVQLMLDLGFNIETLGDWGSPIHHAAWNGHVKIVRLLISRAADLTAKNSFGGDVLGAAIHGAAHAGHKNGPLVVGMIAHALKAGDLSPYIEQAQQEGANEVLAVVQAIQNQRDGDGPAKKSEWKPIMDAALAGNPQRVEKLLKAGAHPNVLSTTAHRYRPLHRAIEHKKTMPKHDAHEQVVKILLEHGADPKLRGAPGNMNALQLAATGEPRFVPLLRKHFEPLDIFTAALLGDFDRVRELLRGDRTLANSRDTNNFTPLHYCAASALFRDDPKQSDAQLKVARALIDAGADPNATYPYDDQWPIPVLYHAAGQHNNSALAALLMDAGANPCDGESIYHAADEGHQECLDLFEKRVDPKKLAAAATGALPNQLHWGRSRGMKWLLTHGANPNVLSKLYGDNALHAATRSGANEKVIAMLLKYGADPRVKNRDGKTPIQLAARRPRIVQQLRQHLKGRTR